MTEAELRAMQTRVSTVWPCRRCGGWRLADPAQDDGACPVHRLCGGCVTRWQHGQECRQSCADIVALVAEVRRLRVALGEIRDAALQPSVTKADDGTVLSTGVYCCACDAEADDSAPLLHNTMTGYWGWMAPCGIAQAALAGGTHDQTDAEDE